jgi:hypothetical protein
MHIIEIGQMKKIKINSWDEFQPLEAVVVGSTYDSSFFDGVKNKKIKDVFKKIVDETTEDIEYFKTQMKSHNIEVFQATPAELGYHSSILDYADVNGRIGNNSEKFKDTVLVRDVLIPIHPLQVRDDAVVMGDKILITDKTFEVNGYVNKFQEWFGANQVDLTLYNGKREFKRTENNFKDFIETLKFDIDFDSLPDNEKNEILSKYPLQGFCSPNITRIGKKCLVDLHQTEEAIDYLKELYPHFTYNKLMLGGHNDGIFSVLKPGLVIAGSWFKGQEHNFKDWDIIYFEDPRWDNVADFHKLKEQNKGKWWVPGEEENYEFTTFVESILPNWTGFVEETIFDLNCLVVDDKHVVVNSNSKELHSFLKQHNLEPIYCPLRHRFFWDGGWHCLTLDVRRSGGQNDYGL